MYLALPPLNHWQCFVVDRQNVVLHVESASQFIAYKQVRTLCRRDTAFCDESRVLCRFNGGQAREACWVADDLGHRWMSQNQYQPCERALFLCQQSHRFTQRYNLHCWVLGAST